MYDDTLEHRVDGALYVDGSESVYNLVQDNRMKEVLRFDIRLISQFKNGGQSSNRLERLVDENRNIFVEKVVDNAIKLFFDKDQNISKISNLVIYGPSRFKNDVFSSKKCKLSKYFKNITLITTANCLDLDEVFAYLNQVIDPNEEKTVLELQTMISMADTKLEFGNDVIKQLRSCMLEKLVVTETIYNAIIQESEITYDLDIIIIRSDKYLQWIENFGGKIGVRWF